MKPTQTHINKDNYISVAKAIGIILMVVGHSGCPIIIHNFIYMFHMPLFFFCSGLFYKNKKTKKELLIFCRKKIKNLYLPYIKWSLIFLLLHNTFYSLNIYNDFYGYLGGDHLYSFEEIVNKAIHILFTMTEHGYLLGGFWFLKTLFLSSLLVATITYLIKKDSTLIDIIAFFLLIISTILLRRFNIQKILFLEDISIIIYSAVFFILGKIFKTYSNVRIYDYKYFIISFFIIILSVSHYKELSMFCGYNKVIPFSITAISGIYMALYISKLVNNTKIKNLMYYIGKNTLIILSLHFLTFKLVSLLQIVIYHLPIKHLAEYPTIENSNSFFWIIYSLAGITIPLLIHYIYDKIKS